MNVTARLWDRVLEGIADGMDRQWHYAKDLLKIRPEYLLTVSVADAIVRGFDNISGMEIAVRLEAPTEAVHRDLVFDEVGWNDYFDADLTPISRQGCVDIYVKCETGSHVVELKNINPSGAEMTKEVVRLGELLLVNDGKNHCRSCHIGFPSSTSDFAWVRDIVSASIDSRLTFSLPETDKIITGEDPEDGLPVYFPMCVTLWRPT